ASLRCDLDDRRADAVESGLAVGVHIIATGGVVIADVRYVPNKNYGGGKFQRSFAAVFGDLLDFSIRRDRDDCISLICRDPKLATSVKVQSIRPLQQRILSQQRWFPRIASLIDGYFPDCPPGGIRYMKNAHAIKNQPIFNDWLRGGAIRERARVRVNPCDRLGRA